ncbi:MAG: hypothetical protein GTO14_06400 [Anaerolineales bacterium]|nr:hypothetical protein [Anaerolineales bacterium]
MSTEIPAPQERKLKSLRKILLFCFAGISVPLIVTGAFAYLILINRIENSTFAQSQNFASLAFLPWLGMAVLVFVTGAVCLVIYYAVKYRLERDDEPFL